MPDPTPNNPLAAAEPESSANTLAPTPVPRASGAAPVEEADQLDAANASLAGALAVSFAVLRIVMLLLIAVFLLSGFFTVAPDEIAVRTRFGKIIPGPEGLEVLTPEGGPYFRWPAPVGQVYRIPTVPRVLKIDESFVFRAARHAKDRPLSELSQGPRLDPQYDGALLTADQSIVHARYEVSYKVNADHAASFVRNVASVADLDTAVANRTAIFRRADEVVLNAVEQAIVEDVAATTLDRFLQGGRSLSRAANGEAPVVDEAGGAPGGTDQGAAADVPPLGEQQPAADAAGQPAEAGDQKIAQGDDPEGEQGGSTVAQGAQEDQVRANAQRVLDDLNAGITLVNVTRTEQTVVSSVRDYSSGLAVELDQARTRRNVAEQYRNNELIAAAGPSFEAVLAIIDTYEEADRLRQTAPERFASAEQAIAATFEGQALGPVLQSLAHTLPEESPQRARLESLARQHANGRLGGSAGNIVNSAAANASAYVAALEAEASGFEKMLALYREHPDLVRRKELTLTLGKIFSSPDVETSFIAPGSDLRLLLNREREAELEDESRARAGRLDQAKATGAANRPAPTTPPAPAPRPGAAPDDGHDH